MSLSFFITAPTTGRTGSGNESRRALVMALSDLPLEQAEIENIKDATADAIITFRRMTKLCSMCVVLYYIRITTDYRIFLLNNFDKKFLKLFGSTPREAAMPLPAVTVEREVNLFYLTASGIEFLYQRRTLDASAANIVG